MRKICFVLVLLMVVFSLAGLKKTQAREAQVYAITDWISECPAGDRSWWDDMGDAWYDEITDCGVDFFGWCLLGHCGDCYSRDKRRVNGSMTPARFAEELDFTWAHDRTYVDEADAAMVCLHGGDDDDYWRGKCRYKAGGDCYINAEDELRVGDYDLEFLHLSSCHSLDDNMIPNTWRVFRRAGSSRILHQLDGFHG